ncbi:MAG: dipeptidase [Longimicrobiales bacterium]
MTMNRRDFLSLSAAFGSLGAAYSPLRALGVGLPGQEWPSLEGRTVINALGGITNPNLRLVDNSEDSGSILLAQGESLDPRAVEDLVASGSTAVNVTMGYVAGPMDPFEHSVADVLRWNRLVGRTSELVKVRKAEDITQAQADGKVGVIFGFQNAAMMEEGAYRADTFADLGVRIIQLTYNVRNSLGDGSMVPENNGLTALGHEVLERLQGRNILVDLSHSGERTCLDAIEASEGPISITHTGCRALADLPRNKTDEELRLLADKGGVAGIYFMPFLQVSGQPDAEDVVLHIEHAINICGEDHVGIGTDGGTTAVDDMDAFRAVVREEVRRRAEAGIGATGESADVVPMIPDLRGPTQFRKLAGLLRARGHSWDRVEKVLGGNFLRLMHEVW